MEGGCKRVGGASVTFRRPGELRSPQDSSDWPSSNLRVSSWTLGMGGCESGRVQERGDGRDGAGRAEHSGRV